MRRALAISAVALAGLFVVPGVAQAATDYVIVTAPATVSAASVGAGGVVTFGGAGFAVNTPVVVDVTYISGGAGQAAPITSKTVQTGRADSSGVFSTDVKLTRAGVAQLTATGLKPDGSTLQLTAVVTVLGSSDSGSGSSGSGSSGSGSSGSGSSGTDSGSGSTSVEAAAANGSSLPRTGAANLGPELWLAGGLLVVGAGFVSVSVARRRTQA